MTVGSAMVKALGEAETAKAVMGEIFGHHKAVEILVFASPAGYMLTSSGFSLLNWGIF